MVEEIPNPQVITVHESVVCLLFSVCVCVSALFREFLRVCM